MKHYRFSLQGLVDDEITSIEMLQELPFLDRQAVRQKERLFVDERHDLESLFKDKTSGSTGTALTVYWRREALQEFWAAFEVRVRNEAGVSRHSPRAMLGGRPIVRGASTSPPYWRRNRFWRQLYLSSYHLSRSTTPDYVSALRESGVEWLTGYGSAIGSLAQSAIGAGLDPVPMKCVIVSGDTLQPAMRRSIETFFECRCFDSYGQVEGVAMAMECREGRLHVIPEVGIVEIVRPDGSPCDPGEVGEIVATGLINDVMPLIRYRTGDQAAFATEQYCPCGSSHPVIEALEGRVDDYLVTSDGRHIGRLSTAMKRSESIHSAQIVQDRPGHAYLLVRPGEGYVSEDALAVRGDILERIGKFEVEVVEVEEIPRTPTGKTRLVTRLVDRPELAALYEEVLRQSREAVEKRRIS